MFKHLLVCLSFVVSLPVSATETTKKVNIIVSEARNYCENDGGTFTTSENTVVTHTFNNNETLTIVDENGFQCSLAASYYQGSAGAVVHLITPNDYKYGYARGIEVTTTADEVPVVLMLLHGVSCGTVGYHPCVQAFTMFEGKLLTAN